ncbi:GIY-YIG nuclease family protein [Flavobacterium pectinovorum]|uniref:GIY-YIG nuclease family protein n=1 Tax=Flavobacterium pectinovorum TaxID=29533 RepID=A0A502EJN6_9FLAO|nr:GIY-YIG nuclease family protein [Flavobacterium pectinovorum]
MLFSESKNRFYIGFTSNLEERLLRHNQKSKGFIGNVNDWKVVYTENYETKELAHKRELQIKAWKSRIKIQELIKNK